MGIEVELSFPKEKRKEDVNSPDFENEPFLSDFAGRLPFGEAKRWRGWQMDARIRCRKGGKRKGRKEKKNEKGKELKERKLKRKGKEQEGEKEKKNDDDDDGCS